MKIKKKTDYDDQSKCYLCYPQNLFFAILEEPFSRMPSSLFSFLSESTAFRVYATFRPLSWHQGLTFRQVWVPTRSTRCFQNAKSFSLWLFTYGDGGESLLRIASHLIPTCRTGKNGGKPAPANCPSWNLEVLLWLNPRQSNHYRDSALSDPP